MIAGLALYLVLVAPPIAAWLERTMAGHMLLQVPLLALAGGLVARGIFGRHGAGLAGFNAAGIAGLLVAVFVAAVWMLPRTLDAALRDPLVEAAKFTSVPLLIGAPLALSWPLLPPVARAFVWANVISHAAVLGWLYRAAPDRLCARYLFDQQATVGAVLLIIAAVLLFALASYAIAGSPWQGRTVGAASIELAHPPLGDIREEEPWIQA